MKSKQTHFITGATGFIGSAIILELLVQTSDQMYCLVRQQEHVSANERLFSILYEIIDSYNYPQHLKKEVPRRCIVVAGDLTTSFEQIKSQTDQKIDQIWHIAASLRYQDRYKEEIININVKGTEQVLKWAKAFNVKHVNHFSTAYVAGKKSGIIPEEKIEYVETNNVYEQSKIAAENIVLSTKDIPVRIFRPGIVVGHSQTHIALNFNGLYGFVRKLAQFKGIMERVQQGYLSRETITFCVDPEVSLNFVPIDRVAKEAVAIAFSSSTATFFHLTNDDVPIVGESIETIFRLLKLKSPKFIPNPETLNWIDQQLDKSISFYTSYFFYNKQFSRLNTNSALGTRIAGNFSTSKENLMQYCAWYIDYWEQNRKEIPVSR